MKLLPVVAGAVGLLCLALPASAHNAQSFHPFHDLRPDPGPAPVQWESPAVLESGRTDVREAVVAERLERLPPSQAVSLAGLVLLLGLAALQDRDVGLRAPDKPDDPAGPLTRPTVRALTEVQHRQHGL